MIVDLNWFVAGLVIGFVLGWILDEVTRAVVGFLIRARGR